MENFIKYIQNKKLSENTIKTYQSSLKILEINKDNWKLIIKNLFNPNFSANTIHLHKNVLMSYLKFKKKKAWIQKLELIKLPQHEIKYYQVISKNLIYKKTELKLNDKHLIQKWKIIIKFLFETGIRAIELNNLTFVNNKLFVLGKGNKKRQIFFVEETLNELKNFLPDLNHQETSKTLRVYVKKILGKKITPHTLRRSFATHMLNNGVNPKSLMLQMGHSKIETTFRYLNLSETYNKRNYLKAIKK
ncbi:tyrosine-type recombinase/integrase [Candidatus Mycoplasma pogonae]